MTIQERVQYWDSFPERKLIQQSGMFDRRDMILHVSELIGKPRVLEIGVDRGDVLKHCADSFGKYTGVDVEHRNIEVKLIPRCEQNFINADSVEFWKNLDKSERFDLVFVDGHHGLLESYLDITQAMFRLSSGGYILVHDVGHEDVSAGWSHNRLKNIPGWYSRILDGHPEGLSIYFKI